MDYYVIIFYYLLYLILVGPICIGLTFMRASSARPSRQLGFPTDVLLLLLLSCYHPCHPWKLHSMRHRVISIHLDMGHFRLDMDPFHLDIGLFHLDMDLFHLDFCDDGVYDYYCINITTINFRW